jgi:pimeloyl-ACP methyl ester carboxylesterase
MDKYLKAGVNALRAGERDKAFALLSRAVKSDPRSADNWFWLGRSASDRKQQIYCFRRALKLDPNYEKARKYLEHLGELRSVPAPSKPSAPFEPETFIQETPPLAFEEPEVVSEPEPQPKPYAPRKKKTSIKRSSLLILVVLGVFALFSVLGVAALFIFRPTFLLDMVTTVLPQASSSDNSVGFTATEAVVVTPTAQPFSALSMVEYIPVFESAACTFQAPENVRVDCGYVVVPENRYVDANKTIRLAVAIYRGSDPNAVPILYLQGGPGQATVELMSEYFDFTVAPLLNERDFILLDQRGMGLSEPNLDCPLLDIVFEDDAEGSIPEAQREEKFLNAFRACRDRLTTDGVDLSSYNTMESAADVKDVIVALGYQQATLFGVSYGTRLAQVVMRENPEVVYSSVLDSVLPVESKVYNESAAVAQASLDTLFAGCAADPECNRTYPNLEADLREVVTQLEAKPMRTTLFGYGEDDYSRKVDGTEFMSTILWAMRDPELQGIVPQAIGRTKSGEANMLGFILSFPVETVSDINLGAYLSINCREQVYASTPKEIGEDLASYPDTETVGLSWVYGDPNFIYSLCDTWQVEGPRADETEALTSDIPTLVMAGEYDSTTPPFWAKQVAERLGRGTYAEFPGMGHGVAFSQTSFCPNEILQSFLTEPETPPDISCTNEMSPPDFAVPYSGETPIVLESIVDEFSGIGTYVPMDWELSIDMGSISASRQSSTWDLTSVSALQVGVDFDTAMAMMAGDFEGLGLDSYPIQTGEITAGDLIWELYKATALSQPLDIAFAQDGYKAIMVFLLSYEDERDILYDNVFIPMLESTYVVKP